MFSCPVCCYPDLAEVPVFSYEICPCCGTEFGYDDYVHNPAEQTARHDQLRKAWEAAGKPWFDPSKRS